MSKQLRALTSAAISLACASMASAARPAAALVVNVGGSDYDVQLFETSADAQPGLFQTPPSGSMPWFGDQSVANAFAVAVGDSLGIPTIFVSGALEVGPFFAWELPGGVVYMDAYCGPNNTFPCDAGSVYSFGPTSTYGSPPTSEAYSYAVATRIPATSVPAPLPLLGAAAAFRCSRRLRKRLKQAGPSRRSA